jgi:hypothetical protein
MGLVFFLCILVPFFVVSTSAAASLGNETVTVLGGLLDARAMVLDELRDRIWVGGVSTSDPTKGALAYVELSSRNVVSVGDVVSSVLSGTKISNTAYFGLANGQILQVNLASATVTATLLSVTERRIDFLELSPSGGILYMQHTEGNFCGLESWSFPLTVRDTNGWSGHNSASSAGIALSGNSVFSAYDAFCCGPTRTKWVSPQSSYLFQNIDTGVAADKQVRMTRSANGDLHFLIRSGKLLTWTESAFSNFAPTRTVTNMGATSSSWRALFVDSTNGILWAASEDGKLVEIPVTGSSANGTAASTSSAFAFWTGLFFSNKVYLLDHGVPSRLVSYAYNIPPPTSPPTIAPAGPFPKGGIVGIAIGSLILVAVAVFVSILLYKKWNASIVKYDDSEGAAYHLMDSKSSYKF